MKLKWWKSASDWQQDIINGLQEQIDMLVAEATYHRERADQAINALLAYQQKPTVHQPSDERAMNFLDKHMSLYRDEDGGEEVA